MEVGFIFFGIPFRLGELCFFLFFLRLIDLRSILKITKLHSIGFIIVFLLLVNVILVFTVKFFCDIDGSFYSKYLLRNILYCLAITSFILKPINFEKIRCEFYIRYFLSVTFIFYCIEYVDYYLINFNWRESVFVSKQNESVAYNMLLRFAGQSSEPAYIVPLLSIPLIYGLFSQKFKYSIFSVIFILLTFSSFGYLVLILSLFFIYKNNNNSRLKARIRKLLLSGLVIISIIALFFINRIQEIAAYNWMKMKAYFRIDGANEWSASQRAGHIELALDLFDKSTWLEKLFGNGTGYYSKMSKLFDEYYLDNAEEAHNLYLSTLTDRGVLGIMIIIILFYAISKIKIPNDAVGDMKYFFIAIKFGVYVRMVHWFFTGMLWQYYFWVEVSLLISISAYYIKMSNERKRIRF